MQTLRSAIPKIIAFLVAAAIIASCSPEARKLRILKRADGYFEAGEYDKAKIEYLNVLRRDSNNVRAFQQIGFVWVEQGLPFRAIPFLLKVRELDPQNAAARAKLALSFMALGQSAEARKEASFVLERDPGNADALLVLMDASQSKEDIDLAEQHLQKFPQRDTATFHLASATLALRKSDLQGASDEAQKMLAIDPKSPEGHVAMAYVYLLRRDMTHAGAEFKTAAELSSFRSKERIKFAEFQIANGASSDAKASLEQITQKAPDYLPAWRLLSQIALAEKKYDEALALLQNIFSRDPENPDCRIFQSDILLAKGDTDKAIAILNGMDAKYPNNPSVKYQLARAHLQNKNPAQATVAFEQAVAANPNYTEAILALGDLNLRSGKPQVVVAAMEDLVKKRPDLSQARLLLANAYQALNRPDEAIATLREQVKVTPQSADAYFILGQLLDQQKKGDDAREAFERAAQLAPDNLTLINHLVTLDLAAKRYDVAMQRVQQQLQKNPDAVVAHFMEGRIYAAQRDWPRAEVALQKAIARDANFAPAYNLLISIYLDANKLPEALTQLQAGLAKDPDNEEALMAMAGVYDQMEDYAKARDTYEKLLTLDDESADALNNLADLYSEHFNQLDKAYELARKARNIEPDDESIADTLGWIFYKRGDYQQALRLLQESAAKLPDEPEVQFHLGMTNYMMGRADAARSAFEQALRAGDGGDDDDFPDKTEAQNRLALLQGTPGQQQALSVDELEALLKRQPNDPVVVSRVAESYEKQGEVAKAATAYEEVLKLNPKFALAALKLAQIYAGPLQKPDKALEFAKKARELAPNDAQVAGALGHVALQANNFTWAYSLLQESARQRRNDPATLQDLALAAYALGKVPEARQTMQRSLDAAPNTEQAEEAKRFLAMTAFDQSSAELVAAEPEIKKILQSKPDYVPALVAQAGLQLQRHDAKTAAGIYSQILQNRPDFAPAQKGLATIYADNPDDLANAYELAMKARKTLSGDPELARTLAELNFKRKEFHYAIQLFEESATKQPLPPKDLYYLGMAQLQSRQEKKGRETLEQALAAGLQDPLAEEAKQKLAAERPK